MAKLIPIDEHGNIVIDPAQVESVTVDADATTGCVVLKMKTGDVHRVNRYYRQTAYQTHGTVIAKINEVLA